MIPPPDTPKARDRELKKQFRAEQAPRRRWGLEQRHREKEQRMGRRKPVEMADEPGRVRVPPPCGCRPDADPPELCPQHRQFSRTNGLRSGRGLGQRAKPKAGPE